MCERLVTLELVVLVAVWLAVLLVVLGSTYLLGAIGANMPVVTTVPVVSTITTYPSYATGYGYGYGGYSPIGFGGLGYVDKEYFEVCPTSN
ncbi:unnamed protein product [Ceratitis capitata]|uniref:(Mediterranean fruit fly) hypothetical protein n=1 Tax=Ceratitis capitata TaxID=7213 RepID=A0A811VGG2_CERCA|nr:unnamed protein product [Ceratitis capitata]